MAEIVGENYLMALNRFASTVWGGGQTLLEQLRPGVEFINLGEYFDAFQDLFGLILQHDKILVRDEYRAALQALDADPVYQRGAYVIGQLGIGKTYFLIYVIIERLRNKQPVALQFLDGRPLYALFTDKVTIHSSLSIAEPLLNYPGVWALCDSNGEIKGPAGIFKRRNVRIIQTTSPRASRWKEWSKQFGADRYVMDIWSESEIADLATLMELDIGRMTDLAQKWGGVPRTLLRCIEQEECEIEMEFRRASDVAVRDCATVINALARLDLPETHDVASAFYFIRPMEMDDGRIYHTISSTCVPTRTLRQLLAEALQGKDATIKLRFFRTLSCPSLVETSQTASFIYESWFHSFISAGRHIRCQWAAKSPINGIPTELPATTSFVVVTENRPSSWTPPFYWVPSHGHLPGIDGVLVLEEEIFVFAIREVVTSNHGALGEGLRRLRQILPDDLKDIVRRVLFIGLEEVYLRRFAEEWASKLETGIPVGWSEVDPVQSGVTYRVFHDESDPVLTGSQAEDELMG